MAAPLRLDSNVRLDARLAEARVRWGGVLVRSLPPKTSPRYAFYDSDGLHELSNIVCKKLNRIGSFRFVALPCREGLPICR
jgi:hypothetical protein